VALGYSLLALRASLPALTHTMLAMTYSTLALTYSRLSSGRRRAVERGTLAASWGSHHRQLKLPAARSSRKWGISPSRRAGLHPNDNLTPMDCDP
jgi:hypothetical protein